MPSMYKIKMVLGVHPLTLAIVHDEAHVWRDPFGLDGAPDWDLWLAVKALTLG
jgi:hypothetical protein